MFSQGTHQFMAIDILEGQAHQCMHDMESYYWVLIWVLLCHANHGLGKEACSTLFDVEATHLAASQKRTWLIVNETKLSIHDNEPLTHLLRKLGELFHHQVNLGPRNPEQRMSVNYDRLLAVINAALAQDTWPEGDKA